jgi:hypothetical protein
MWVQPAYMKFTAQLGSQWSSERRGATAAQKNVTAAGMNCPTVLSSEARHGDVDDA